jgi:hypothetical protein
MMRSLDLEHVRMNRRLAALLWLGLTFGAAATASAQVPRLSVDEDTWLQLRFLGQFQAEAAEKGAGVARDEWSYDFFTRRARIMASGSVHRRVRFFISTDVPNTGKAGVRNDIVWNDGFVDVHVAPQLNIAFGRLIAPLSPDIRASAATLLGIDYNLNLIKSPTPVDRAFWRDDGIELRGVLGGGLIEYRGGVFSGLRAQADNTFRTTGMAMLNLRDAQPGAFYNPNSLGSLRVMSVGAGIDRIPSGMPAVDNSLAWSVFALVEEPLGAGRFNAMATYYDWDGPAWAGGFQGTTMGVQVGYLLPATGMEGRWQPVVRFQRQDNPGADFELNTINVGLNYLLRGHTVNWKLDYAINDRRVDGETANTVRLQAQILF